MDPLSAVSLAAAVIQFVDFGSRLLRDTVEIYRPSTNQVRSPTDVLNISQDLSALSEEVESKSRLAFRKPSEASEEIFIHLCETCRDIGTELQECVADVKIYIGGNPGRVVHSFLSALQQRRSAKKIDTLRSRLDQTQQRMMTSVLVFLWGEAKHSGQEMSQMVQRQTEILDTLERMQQTTHDANATSTDLTTQESTISPTQLQSAIWDLLHSKLVLPESTDSILQTSNDPFTREEDMQICRDLINTLFFENLRYREQAIHKAHAKTFEWIFHKPVTDSGDIPAWSSFPDWLEDDSTDIYWITGKPGAGKSTLLKFIVGDPRTREHLEKWAIQPPLLFLDYYSWNAGSGLQKSHEGLLRTMLYQALYPRPDLVPKVILARWAMLKLYGKSFPTPPLEIDELLDIFHKFVTEVTKEGRLFLVIDGLDEFEGNHQRLVDLVREISTLPRLKICVSSRPWNVFRDAFDRGPSLKVEKLTRSDIELYVQDHFGNCEGFRELREIHFGDADILMKDIVDKAQGVFLWVKVVVVALLDGLVSGDRLVELRTTLEELPEDLSRLFQTIWDKIDPRYHEEASELFQIMEAAGKFSFGLPAFVLWLSDKEHSIELSAKKIKSINRRAIILALKRRLSSRTKGLLELHDFDDNRVDYMHRSVRDWIMECWGQPQSLTKGDFDPHLTLLKGKTLQVVDIATSSIRTVGQFWDIVSALFGYASYVNDIESNRHLFFSALDRVDKELKRLSCSEGSKVVPHDYILYSREYNGLSPDALPHWSTIQALSKRKQVIYKNLPQTNYIGFVSQIPLASYVRTKVLANRSILHPADTRVLSPAEMVPITVGFMNCWKKGRPLSGGAALQSNDERLELLKFFINEGANVSEQKQWDLELDSFWRLEEGPWKDLVLKSIEEAKARNTPCHKRMQPKDTQGRVSRFFNKVTFRTK